MVGTGSAAKGALDDGALSDASQLELGGSMVQARDDCQLEVGVSMVYSVGVGAALIGDGLPEFGPKLLAALRR